MSGDVLTRTPPVTRGEVEPRDAGDAQREPSRWRVALLERVRSPSGLAIVAGLVMVALYFVLRSPHYLEQSRILLTTWALAACAVAVASPRAGLIVLVGVGPFGETALFNDFLRAKTLIATFLLGGVAVRAAYTYRVRRREASTDDGPAPGATPVDAAAGRWSAPAEWIFDRLSPLTRPVVVLGLAALVVTGTGLSLWLVSLPLGEPFGSRAATAWGGGIWTPFAAMFAAVWLGWRGDRTVLVVTAVLGIVSAVVGLAAYTWKDAFVNTPLAWVVDRATAGTRLVGVIDVPNAAATIFLAPFVLLACAAVFVRDTRLRLAAGAGALVILAAMYFTFSRSALIALAFVVAIVAWRYSRRLGLVVVVVGILTVAVLLPRFLEVRRDAAPAGSAGVEALGDASRIQAWTAAVLMWRDAPLTGHGFRTYQLLHAQYGEPEITAPHNEWLRLFAEEGTIIGLAGLAFVGATALTLARPRGWLAAAIFGIFVAYVLMASVNNPLTYVQVGLMVFPVIGIGLGMAWAARASPASVAVDEEAPVRPPVAEADGRAAASGVADGPGVAAEPEVAAASGSVASGGAALDEAVGRGDDAEAADERDASAGPVVQPRSRRNAATGRGRARRGDPSSGAPDSNDEKR